MNVLYTCDDNYVWLMGISAISLFESNQHIQDISVYLLGEKISSENKQNLQEISSKYNRSIYVIDVPKIDVPKSLISNRWPLSAFTRLYAGQLLPKNLTQILYLDCDTVIIDNIEYLENVDMGNNVVCGVKDCIGRLYKENIGLSKDDLYINAGVLLLDLKKLRKINLKNVIDTYMKRYEKFISYADQDILNGIFKNKIGVLPPQYNVMTIDIVHSYKEIYTLRKPTNFYSESELKQAIKMPCIVHYTTNMCVVRPWYTNTNHPFGNRFEKYFLLSPWKEKKLSMMKFTSRESRIINSLMKFPKPLAFKALGIIHFICKPLFIRVKGCLGW